jgi:hypothetical protein
MEGRACDLVFGSPIGKSCPYAGLDRPLGIQDVEAPRISESEGGKFVIPTQRPLSLRRDNAGTHFRWRLSLPQYHSGTGMIK